MKRINIRMSPPVFLLCLYYVINYRYMLIKIANCYNDVYFMARCFIYNRFCLYGYRAWCCGHRESIYLIWPMCHFNTYTSGRTWHYELCRFNCDYAWQKNWPSKPNFTATSIKSNEYRRCHSSCQSIIFILFTVECIAAFILSFEWVPKYGIAKGSIIAFFIPSLLLTMQVFLFGAII